MLFFLLLPALIIFVVSFIKQEKPHHILAYISFLVIIPTTQLLLIDKPYALWGDYLVVDKINAYVLFISSVVAIAVSLSLLTLDKHVSITKVAYRRFYRAFSTFWIGLIFSIMANNMGIYWIGLELATLSTVYMIQTNTTRGAVKETWNYLIVGTIAISLILFGIILIYSSAKPTLGEEAMSFSLLLAHANEIDAPYLFEIGFAIVSIGMFIKMGFFPMNLWLANVERASFYPVAALLSGILESAIIMGFFRFSKIAMEINQTHLVIFVFSYMILTLFVVSFLIYRTKDFMRLFSLSGVEHMALIVLFWVSGGVFPALLHFGAHAFLKPALFLSTGVLESNGKYRIAGALRGYSGKKGKLFWILVSLFLLGLISLPPSPMFFSELYGFSAMVDIAKESKHMIAMLGAIFIILLLLSIIFYKFVEVSQSMKYEGELLEKKVYWNELLALLLFAVSLLVLLSPPVIDYLKGI